MQSMVAVLVLLCVLCSTLSTGVVSASVLLKPEAIQPSHNHTFTFGYTGGAPFCTQCGSPGAYACSDKPNWVATQTFRDNYHPNSVVLGVTAILSGSYACTSPVAATTLAVSLNGVTIDIVSVDGKQNCKCNTCDGYVTLGKATPLGWPTYSNDGTVANNVTISVYTGSICLNSLTVILSYGSPTYPLQTAYKVVPWGNGGSQSYGICGLTYYTSGAGTINFSDFLPENSILYSVDVQVFGVYFVSSSGYCSNATVSMALNNFPIGDTLTLAYPRQNLYSSNVVTTPCRTYGCDGKWLFSMAQLYQNGVPNYNYQSSNSLVFHGASQTKMAFAAMWFYYLPKSSAPLILN